VNSSLPGVQVEDSCARVRLEGEDLNLPLVPLPPSLMDWFLKGRHAGYESLARGEGPGPLFSRHLPVVATEGGEGPFSIRLAHKGVGFLPHPDRLPDILVRYEDLHKRTREMAPERSLEERLRTVVSTFEEPGSADPRHLGSLEIFAGQTLANLSRRPLASLLFTDPGHGYRSFQLDCVVQILEPPDPRFRFLQLARGLFERDPFHVTQPGINGAYLFWIVGIHDKTPFPMKSDAVRHKV